MRRLALLGLPAVPRFPGILLAVIALAACDCGGGGSARGGRDAGAHAGAARDAGPPAVDAGPSVEHVVVEGETLWAIGRAYGVRVQDIIERNHLRPDQVRGLSKGRRLIIPGATAPLDVAATTQAATPEPEVLEPITDGAYHHLADGETLWDLARRYDVTVEQILERNQLSEDEASRI